MAIKELERLHSLEPTLNKQQLFLRAYKAVIDHWLEFECSNDLGRKMVEADLIEHWFQNEYQYRIGLKVEYHDLGRKMVEADLMEHWFQT
jgi:hypothetical protein